MDNIPDNSYAQPDQNISSENSALISDPIKQAESPAPKRLLGAMKGIFTLPDNFDEIDKQLDKEIEELFLGSEIEPQPEGSEGPPAES